MNPVRSTLVVFVTLLVLIGTAYLTFTRLPEEQFILSEDGVFSIEAMTGSDVTIDVTKAGVGREAGAAVVGNVYYVTPSEARLSEAANIRIRYTDELVEGLDLANLTIAYYDLEVEAWRAVPTSLDRTRQMFSAETGHLSSWALIQTHNLVKPSQVNDSVALLREMSPSGATGFVMELAYSIEGDDYILSEEIITSGGCGGIYQVGEHTVQTEEIFLTSAQVDGVHQEVDFKLVATWEIGQGCPEAAPLSSTSTR